MSQTQPLPPKKEVALALLERSSVYVHLDPRQTAAVVPPNFKKQAQLVLQVGLKMAVPIPDLRLDDDGISCTLSFNRSPFFCVVPWSSVFAMVGEDGRGMVWPDDVPAEVTRQAQGRAEAPVRKDAPKITRPREREAKAEVQAKPKRPRRRPALAAVPDGEETAAATSVPMSKPDGQGVARPRPAVIPTPVRRSSAGSVGPARKKRELPPYLRVVK
jgi:stringent starvation protein B